MPKIRDLLARDVLASNNKTSTESLRLSVEVERQSHGERLRRKNKKLAACYKEAIARNFYIYAYRDPAAERF